MAASSNTLKLNIPTIAPRGSATFTKALKVCCAVIVYQVDEAQFCKVVGDERVTLDTGKSLVTLVDANAIVRYFAAIGHAPWKPESRAPDEALVEWEELVLTPSLKDLENALGLANNLIVKTGFTESSTVTPAQIILFSTLYDSIASASPTTLDKFPQLKEWYNRTLNTEWAVEGIQKAAGQTTEINVDGPSAAKGGKKAAKDMVDNGPKKQVVLGTLADRKLVPNSEMRIPAPGEDILPKQGERNILITSALPYVNNVPHLGNIIGSVLSADVFARYGKARCYNTLYICGTDEYGTATETKAIEEGVTPRELCDKYNALHKEVYDWFDIGFDYFGRTTTDQQTEIAQDIFVKLKNNGYLVEDSLTQLFCEKHQAFLADRYVEGTCPKCGYDDARGDQCDTCGTLLDPKDLINPHCKLDNTTPVQRETKHMFIQLNSLQPQIDAWVKKSSEEGKWSRNGRIITEAWLKEGLKQRCITRDLKWGTPVPLPEYEHKVLYVWFDACIGYVSITANYTQEWKQWWHNPDEVKLYQFMGKDNVPFHTVIFPGSQLGTGDTYTMLHHISTTEYLQYEGGKFSKSRNVGVFGNNARDTGIPPDVFRYYLLSARPETGDTQFVWRDFIVKNNSELLANLGNFVNRLIKFTSAKYDGSIPDYTETITTPSFVTVREDVDKLLADYVDDLENVHLRAGLEKAMAVSARGNQFLQDNKIDNTLFSQHRSQCDAVVGMGLNLIYLVSALIYPYMPATAISICEQLNVPLGRIPDKWEMSLQAGHVIGKAAYLFSNIDAKNEEVWRQKYGGDKKAEEAAKVEEKKKKEKKKEMKKAEKKVDGKGEEGKGVVESVKEAVGGAVEKVGDVVGK